MSLEDFITRFQPNCLGQDDATTESLWHKSSCPAFARAVEAIGYSAQQGRECTFGMLAESARRLEVARRATRELGDRLESGILSILVVGSAARGEATPGSDIDFDVFVTDAYMTGLRSRRDKRALTPLELLRNFEQKMRLRIQEDLKKALLGADFNPANENLSLKPFAAEQLAETDDGKLALLHLLNLVFGATPVYREEPGQDMLDRVLADPSTCRSAVLGRIAMIRCRGAALLGEPWVFESPTRPTSAAKQNPLGALHAVAACVSAVIALALGAHDPQMPYWFTFDEAGAIVEPQVRQALEMFFARVTLARCGIAPVEPAELVGQSLETALASLPVALDAIVDHLAEHGADEDEIDMWESVLVYLGNPEAARDLGERLGFC